MLNSLIVRTDLCCILTHSLSDSAVCFSGERDCLAAWIACD